MYVYIKLPHINISRLKLVSIGSHCVSHRDLRFVDEDSSREEIIGSRIALENIIDQKVELLSFPHGGYNDRCIDFAYQAGYERVFTIQPTVGLISPNEFITGRVNVSPDDWPLEFHLKLMGAYRWLPWAYSIKKKIRSL